MKKKLVGIILAAGEGTRMKSLLPKVLHLICGKPMLAYVLDLAKKIKLTNTFAVLGHKKELFKDLLNEYKVKTIYQEKLLGTADAVNRAKNALKNFTGNILILYGDQPLLSEETLEKLIARHAESDASATILTANVENPFGYGRIVRDNYSRIRAIIEEKDATGEQRNKGEINTGIICFKKEPLFKAIAKIKPNNAKKEYYLTDAIRIMADEGLLIEYLSIDDSKEAQGINSKGDLAIAYDFIRKKIINEFMDEGITIVDPNTTYIDCDCDIGEDTVIYPFTIIERGVKIGKFCSIGPFCHLRGQTVVDDNATIGNFTELARSRIGKDVFMKHFSYLGDASVGDKVNIGCGTVSANFDGKNKQKTIIKEGAFIGSDTVFVAPVKIGRKAATGAGAVVTKDVKPGEVVVGVPARPIKSA